MAARTYLCLGLLAALSGWAVHCSPTGEPSGKSINVTEVTLNGSTTAPEIALKPHPAGSTPTPTPKRRLENLRHRLPTLTPDTAINVNKTTVKTKTRSLNAPTNSSNNRLSKSRPTSANKPSKSSTSTTSKPSKSASTTSKSSKFRDNSAHPESIKRKPIQPPTWYRIMMTSKAGEAHLVGPAILLSPNIILVSYYNHKYTLSSPYNDTTYTTLSSIAQPTVNPIRLGPMSLVNQSSKAMWPKVSTTLKHIGLVILKAPQGFLNDTSDELHTMIPDKYPDEDCHAVKFYPKQLGNSTKPSYVYAKVPMTIDTSLCDGRFCYGKPVKKVLTVRNDLTGRHNSGVPIFCKGLLSYINMPRLSKKETEHHRLVPIQMLADELRRYKYGVYKKFFTNAKEPILVPE